MTESAYIGNRMTGASPPSGLTSYDKQNTSLLLKSTWLLYAPLLDIYSRWIVPGLLNDIKTYLPSVCKMILVLFTPWFQCWIPRRIQRFSGVTSADWYILYAPGWSSNVKHQTADGCNSCFIYRDLLLCWLVSTPPPQSAKWGWFISAEDCSHNSCLYFCTRIQIHSHSSVFNRLQLSSAALCPPSVYISSKNVCFYSFTNVRLFYIRSGIEITEFILPICLFTHARTYSHYYCCWFMLLPSKAACIYVHHSFKIISEINHHITN